jgi:hypothetical protein
MGRLLNRDVSKLIGVPVDDLIPEPAGWMFHVYLENAMINGKRGTLEGFRFANKIFEVHYYPMQNGVTISLHDITTQWHVDELKNLLFSCSTVYTKRYSWSGPTDGYFT